VIDTVGRQRAALGIIAVLAIAVAVLAALLFNVEEESDQSDEPVSTAAVATTGGSPVAAGQTGYVPDGCWSNSAQTQEQPYPQWDTAPEMAIDTDATYLAVMTTNKGEMTLELNTEAAPETVNNFICLASHGFYDVTPFHRVIAGFMVQGGDPTGTGAGGPGYQFDDELPGDELAYEKGTLAMANSGPDTQGSQFFIVHDDLQGKLEKNYTIFGQMVDGEAVLDDIADSAVVPNERGEPSVPREFLVIEDITIQVESGS
jgi:cyclophilin family peptidyl-prolyl cis-trans isomerase